MTRSQFLALFSVVFTPDIGIAGDFSNPVPYGTSSAGSGQTSYFVVPIETAEALRIARMDIGTPDTVVNNYVQTNDQCINCVTVGDNATDVKIDATQDGTNACINVTNNILNAQNQAADAQPCGEIVP